MHSAINLFMSVGPLRVYMANKIHKNIKIYSMLNENNHHTSSPTYWTQAKWQTKGGKSRVVEIT